MLFCVKLQHNKSKNRSWSPSAPPCSPGWRRAADPGHSNLRGRIPYAHQTDYAPDIFRGDGGHRPVLPENRLRCQRLRAGRPLGGPWLTAFAYGTSYFPPWSLWATPDSSAGSTASPPPGPALATHFGLPTGVGGVGAPDPHHDPAPQLRHHAGVSSASASAATS